MREDEPESVRQLPTRPHFSLNLRVAGRLSRDESLKVEFGTGAWRIPRPRAFGAGLGGFDILNAWISRWLPPVGTFRRIAVRT
jgi:hypothetical protein